MKQRRDFHDKTCTSDYLAVAISLTAAVFLKLSITPLKVAIVLAFTIFAVCLKEYVYRLRKRIEENHLHISIVD
ncbi:hypothetical protein ACEQPO_22415 [Bacillus sp. SL00103]